jgi:hypothetical protein
VLTACRIAAGFYKATVTNEFLQLFDSLSLYKFLVDHSNQKTMAAVEDLARFFEGAKVGKVVSPAARPAAAHEFPRAPSRPAPRQSASAEQDPDEEPAAGQRNHSEPSADDLRGPEPEEGLDPEKRRVDPRRRVPQAGAEEEAGLVDDRENGQFDFIESGEGADEPDDVIVRVPSPGQTTEAQEDELRSVRDQTIVLPSGTAPGPQSRGKRGAVKGEGGRKRNLNFKTANEDGAAN